MAGFETKQLHAGHVPDSQTHSRAVPIYQTTSYTYDSAEHAASVFLGQSEGFVYSRIDNPTCDVLEKRIASLENAKASVVFSSGMAAISACIQVLCKPGDNIVAASTLYGGSYTLFKSRFPKTNGISCTLVNPDNVYEFENAINENTKCLFIESIGNPNINIPDIDKIAEIAHKHALPLVCDNTFGTPYLIQLKNHGVDIIVTSLTKYHGGHGTAVGGAIIDMASFNWYSGNFDDFTKPDPSNHNIVYAELDSPFAAKARIQVLRDYGACLSPFNAFLILQGIETLSLRMERHCQNALAVAKFLKGHKNVAWVNYPKLKGDKYELMGNKYFPNGAGAILSFGVVGGIDGGRKFINSLKLFSLLANVADAKSLVIHPASTTHGQLDENALKLAGVAPEMIRLSVGLESIEDIIEDLNQALNSIGGK